MNRTIYGIILIPLFSLSLQAMESESGSSSSSMVTASDGTAKMMIPIQIPKARNAAGSACIEHLDLEKEEPIHFESFGELIRAKNKKGDTYILARATEQTEEGSVVSYFDAHALNCTLFGQYPFPAHLDELGKYKNPSSNFPLQWLEYYECEPQAKVFKFMCSYAALRSKNEDKRGFWQSRFYANQEADLKLAAEETFGLGFMYQQGEGVAVDYAKARQLYEQVAAQKDNLGAAASAKGNLAFMYWDGQDVVADLVKAIRLYQEVAQQKDNLKAAANSKYNLGFMYQHGEGVAADPMKAMGLYQEVAQQKDNLGTAACAKYNLGSMYQDGEGVVADPMKAMGLYQEVAQQKDNLGAAACAKNNLGTMYHHGHGVAVDYAKAKKLYEQAANQTHNLEVAADAKNKLAELEALMKKNC